MTEPNRTEPKRNPLARGDDPFTSAPPLVCACGNECRKCHVDVDGTQACFDRFAQVLGTLGNLQDRGLFVAVSGPSSSGKTSLINRCADLAARVLDKAGARVMPVPLTGIGQGPGVTADERAFMVAERLRTKVEGNQSVFDPEVYQAPRSYGTGRSLYPEDFTRAVSDAVRDGAVLIVRTPRTDRAIEVQHYWSGTSRKLLIFAETTLRDLPGVPDQPQDEARPLHLRVGLLNPGDAAEFARTRIDVPGRGQDFPDLDVDAVERLFGGSQLFPIGAIQTLLYNVYAHYSSNPWPAGNVIRLADLEHHIQRQYTRHGPAGREG
ncbi:hypothetical protein GCM10022254_15640 [Actinomadura meridiana]|uniref:Uncharacterized protein n=1 Tax=Actinomadura meridiana TaxID=559626 RepID=A0ABP8BVH8_9ACTN